MRSDHHVGVEAGVEPGAGASISPGMPACPVIKPVSSTTSISKSSDLPFASPHPGGENYHLARTKSRVEHFPRQSRESPTLPGNWGPTRGLDKVDSPCLLTNFVEGGAVNGAACPPLAVDVGQIVKFDR